MHRQIFRKKLSVPQKPDFIGWLFLFFKCTKYTLEIRANNKLKLMSLILLYVYNMIRKLQCYHLCWVVFIDHDQIAISYLTEKKANI